MRLFCDVYGLDASERRDAVGAVAPRLRGMVTYMREAAAAGNEAFARHIAEGHDALYERDAAYVVAHLAELGALTSATREGCVDRSAQRLLGLGPHHRVDDLAAVDHEQHRDALGSVTLRDHR